MTVFEWLADKVNPNYKQGYEDGFNAAVKVMFGALKILENTKGSISSKNHLRRSGI